MSIRGSLSTRLTSSGFGSSSTWPIENAELSP
jgi:hypothetical protein